MTMQNLRRKSGFGLIDMLIAIAVASLAALLVADTADTGRQVWSRIEPQAKQTKTMSRFADIFRTTIERGDAIHTLGGGVIGEATHLRVIGRKPPYPDPSGWTLTVFDILNDAERPIVRVSRTRLADRNNAITALLTAETAQGSLKQILEFPLPDEHWRFWFFQSTPRQVGARGDAPPWRDAWPLTPEMAQTHRSFGAPSLVALGPIEQSSGSERGKPWSHPLMARPRTALASLCRAWPTDIACDRAESGGR